MRSAFPYLIFPLLALLLLPLAAGAQGTSSAPISIWAGAPCAGGTDAPATSCGICDAIIVASNIIQILFELAFPIAVGFIVYGAVRMMLGGASVGSVEDGKETIQNALLGLVIVLCSWLIVEELLHLLSGGGFALPWSTITCS